MKGTRFEYVLPNTSEMNRKGRGGVLQRWTFAESLGCSLVEIPADFVKNRSEVGITDLPIGSFLDARALKLLYRSDPVPSGCKVVFHTEPELTVPGQIRWFDRIWVREFIAMQIGLAEHLGVMPFAIEIHPGNRPNSVADVLDGAASILEAFGKKFGREPLVLLENRTGQVVSDGKHLHDVWQHATSRGDAFTRCFGLVLDIQQLFTQSAGRTRDLSRFSEHFSMVPDGAVKAYHIHHLHRTPTLEDPIPWRAVFQRIRSKMGPFLINPEIHHATHIPAAIRFCAGLLSSALP